MLYGNKIKEINSLQNPNFAKLKILSLGQNEIKVINILQECAFKELEKLDLFSNIIDDINILAKIPFKDKIKELDLSFNKLNNIKVLLNKENFPKLTDLKIEANDGLDYSDSSVKDLYDKYNIKYTYNSIL